MVRITLTLKGLRVTISIKKTAPAADRGGRLK